MFLKALRGVDDPEQKRKIFKRIYRRLLKKAASQFQATHIVQGTLATDLIESGATGGEIIKSHHNVGHTWGRLGELAPFQDFFKYEVREFARALKLPDSVVNREPFPGPGLFIRVRGAVTKERLDHIRWADKKVRDLVAACMPRDAISQLVVALSGSKYVGIKGDARSFEEMVIVRPVKTVDYMTATSPIFPEELMRQIMEEVAKHPRCIGALFDFNPKPSRTTEIE